MVFLSKVKFEKHTFRKEVLKGDYLLHLPVSSLRCAWQLIISGGNIRIFFYLHFNEPKSPAFLATFTFWIYCKSFAVTQRT
jgi:hypothetical protein